MKRFLFVCLILVLGGFELVQVAKNKIRHDIAQPINEPALTPTPTLTIDRDGKTNTSLFVPYWTVKDLSDGTFDSYIYFGLKPSSHGIDTSEAGAQQVDDFISAVPQDKTKLLTLRMVDQDANNAILKDKKLQQKIISQTISFTKDHGFSGVVLDLEISGLPFDSLVTQISNFTHDLATQTKAQHLQFELTLYGDTFYRVRPFDVKNLAKDADNVMIMAYDFNKSRSNPGPNFPLSGQETYGYDMGKMADDFLQVVPNQKLHVIFGLYGYDWPVDNSGNATGQGSPLTDAQIQNKFLHDCKFSACQIKRDPVSAETVIHYTDDTNQKHVVWFEDMQSVATKEKVLKQKGIGNFSFWANSYF
ncbi:MAG: glycosyl hydrolase family 18 protein [Candidatus Levyibacteriota bacterium]